MYQKRISAERNPFSQQYDSGHAHGPGRVGYSENDSPTRRGPNASGLINNFLPTVANPRLSYIPSVKSDYQISPNIKKLSGYWSRTGNEHTE